MSGEEWRWIPGYEGRYEASGEGNIRSWAVRGHANITATAPRLLIPTFIQGYYGVTLRHRGVQKAPFVHKLVALAFYGPRPDGMDVRHLNGNPKDNRVANLRYGTRAENVRDSVDHGTHSMSSRTHCPRNHPYNEANTRISRVGSRNCRACAREVFQEKHGTSAIHPWDMREWAWSKGLDVSRMGAVPLEVRNAYLAEHAAADSP